MSTFIPVPEDLGANVTYQTDFEARALLPASFQTSAYERKLPFDSIFEFLHYELSVQRLNIIRKHLWLAGRPIPARPLQQQVALGRAIITMEQIDLHLLWFRDRIYIKPLPRFLLSVKFWKNYLVANPETYGNAMGLLASYVWLIGHESDFAIAKDKHLVPPELNWSEWLSVVQMVLTQERVSRTMQIERYRYGELRLERVNAIYRFMPGVPNRSLIRGYYREYYTEYSTFFRRNFGLPVALFAVVTIVLAAMQVGLQTRLLEHNDSFQKGCYSFVVFSLMTLVVLLICGGALFVALVIYNLLVTLQPKGHAKVGYPNAINRGSYSSSTRTKV
jgi:hypothetical protein